MDAPVNDEALPFWCTEGIIPNLLKPSCVGVQTVEQA